MRNKAKKLIIYSLILSLFFPILVRAQTAEELAQQQTELQTQLQDIESQISSLQNQLTTTVGEKKTLASKITRLKKEQASLQLQIKATKLRYDGSVKNVTRTAKSIAENELKISRLKKELTDLIRELNQVDQAAFIFGLFKPGGLSEAFAEFENYERLVTSLTVVAKDAEKTRQELATQKTRYLEEQDDARELLAVAAVQQATLGSKLDEQATLLQETKGRESEFQNQLQDTKKRAAEIRGRIYELLGGGKQIDFGQAVSVAKWAHAQTGVKPAFLLAILTQESNLGKNVGTCNRLGDPPEKGWKVIMKPERDQEPFLAITTALGRDPDVTPVSCPMRNKDGSQLGWGGAMGPAQFIPSTWAGYESKIGALVGKTTPDPWDIRDAFAAAAILLKANGAGKTDDGEWKAAMRYFSGSTKVRYRFYGDNVLTLTAKYRQDIKDLEN